MYRLIYASENGGYMSDLQLIKYSNLVDVIDWDNDLKKWTIDDNRLEGLVFTASDACSWCPNHPANGGSGICHCILGQKPIT